MLDELCSETLYLDRASLIAVGWFLVFPFLVASKHLGLGIITYMRPKFSYGLDTFFPCFFFLTTCVLRSWNFKQQFLVGLELQLNFDFNHKKCKNLTKSKSY